MYINTYVYSVLEDKGLRTKYASAHWRNVIMNGCEVNLLSARQRHGRSIGKECIIFRCLQEFIIKTVVPY